MGIRVASDLETTSRPRGGGIEKLAIFAAKLIVTGGCFWYISRQIDLKQVLSAVPLYRVPEILTLGRLNEAAVAALRFVAELGVHQHPWRGTLEINRPRQLDKR